MFEKYAKAGRAVITEREYLLIPEVKRWVDRIFRRVGVDAHTLATPVTITPLAAYGMQFIRDDEDRLAFTRDGLIQRRLVVVPLP